MSETTEIRLAVLIDADNISAGYIKLMIEEIARYGNATIKRVYGDWTRPNLGSWKSILLEYAFQPIQQFGYTYGKNSTDSALIIDAMDILYSGKVDGFCLVSSDSDFTRLATRLREAGKIVYGIGEKKTPSPFIAACDRFIFLEILGAPEDEDDETGTASAEKTRKTAPRTRPHWAGRGRPKPSIGSLDDGIVQLIHNSISDLADESGWAFLGAVGNLVLKKRPSFDPRNYGFNKLSEMIRQIPEVEVEERIHDKNPLVTLVYIRNREDEGA